MQRGFAVRSLGVMTDAAGCCIFFSLFFLLLIAVLPRCGALRAVPQQSRSTCYGGVTWSVYRRLFSRCELKWRDSGAFFTSAIVARPLAWLPRCHVRFRVSYMHGIHGPVV